MTRPNPDLTGVEAIPALTRVVVDLGALARNYRKLVQSAAPTAVGAVVKADAYGLGMPAVAGALASVGCREFFVASLDEALQLRALLPEVIIYNLGGVQAAAVPLLVAARIHPVINSFSEAQMWAQGAAAMPSALQIDSGLTRAGFAEHELVHLLRESGLWGAINPVLLLHHYACADEPTSLHNDKQRRAFERLRALLPGLRTSAANSAGLTLDQSYWGDLARPGIALLAGTSPGALALNAVAHWQAQILQVRQSQTPVDVGYGATVHCPAGTRIALIAVGYADGYPRCLSNGQGWVCYHEHKLPVLGRVSMDLLTIDISALPVGSVQVGDYVTLFGPGLAVQDLAAAAGTLGYEILTGLGRRVRREYVGHPGDQTGSRF